MKIKLTLFFACFLSFLSCQQPDDRSEKELQKAMDVYLNGELEDSLKTERSLSLTNRALELDEENLQALNHKATLLFRKKDIDGLIEIADKLIRLKPEKPFYLGQKAIYLELKGSSKEARKYYEKAIRTYQEILKTENPDFDLMLEYVSILEASGDTLTANKTLEKMKEMDFEDYQKEMVDLYKEQAVPKERLIKYWNGEIQYEDIGEN